jgi:hypothetical protein
MIVSVIMENFGMTFPKKVMWRVGNSSEWKLINIPAKHRQLILMPLLRLMWEQ